MKELSVIIPCYNYGKFLPEAIDSVLLNKDFIDRIEIIVINDGSTDKDTIDLLSSFSNPHVKIIHQANMGLAMARNNGIEAASSEFLLFLDADNKIERSFLIDFFQLKEKEVEFDLLYGNAFYFGDVNQVYKPGRFNLIKLLLNNYIDACMIVRKSCFKEIGYYDTNMPAMGWEDWDLNIRLAIHNKRAIYNDKIYFHYRFHHKSMINSNQSDDYLNIKKYINNKYLAEINRELLKEDLRDIMENTMNNNFKIINIIRLLWVRLLNKLGFKLYFTFNEEVGEHRSKSK